jgi:hypothetical protein
VSAAPIDARHLLMIMAIAVVLLSPLEWTAKFENEGFNVLKNHGYELEHNWFF